MYKQSNKKGFLKHPDLFFQKNDFKAEWREHINLKFVEKTVRMISSNFNSWPLINCLLSLSDPIVETSCIAKNLYLKIIYQFWIKRWFHFIDRIKVTYRKFVKRNAILVSYLFQTTSWEMWFSQRKFRWLNFQHHSVISRLYRNLTARIPTRIRYCCLLIILHK